MGANLAISDNETLNQYTSVGETIFAYKFPILSTNELKVSVNQDLKTIGVDYSVSGVGDAGGGNVTFAAATTAGQIITIWQDMPFQRSTGFSLGAATLIPDDLNTEFARQVRHDQQLRRDIKAALRIAVDDPNDAVDMVLPARDTRKGKFLRFNDTTGKPEVAELTASTTVLSQDVIANLLWPQTAAESAAAVTPVEIQYPPGDLRRYGLSELASAAVNTQAIHDGMAANSLVTAPAGTFPHNQITVPLGARIQGESAATTIFAYVPTSGDAWLLADDAVLVTFLDLTLTPATTSSGWAIAPESSSAANDAFTIERFYIFGFLKGIRLGTAFRVKIDQGVLQGQGKAVSGGVGIELGAPSPLQNTECVIIDVPTVADFETGLYFKNGDGVVVNAPQVLDCTTGLRTNQCNTVVNAPVFDGAWNGSTDYWFHMEGGANVTIVSPTVKVSGTVTENPEGLLLIGNNAAANRMNLILNKSTHLVSGTFLTDSNLALHANWGTTASISAVSGSKYRARFTVTSAGTGQGANPTITLTFPGSERFITAPFAIVERNGGDQASVKPTWTTTTTTLVITFPGTPVAAQTYTFEFIIVA